jgi:hypothetical protein
VAVPVPVAVPQPVRTKYVPYGPPAVGGWHEVITASGDDVLIRSGPSTGYSKLAAVPTGTLVQTSCYVFGETINGNSIWDRVSSPYVGYIADAFVADTASVPAC